MTHSVIEVMLDLGVTVVPHTVVDHRKSLDLWLLYGRQRKAARKHFRVSRWPQYSYTGYTKMILFVMLP